MEDRAEGLRRRIATYRRWLAEGVSGETAQTYPIEIAKAEAELAQIVEDNDRHD